MPFELVASTGAPEGRTAATVQERIWHPHSSTDVYTRGTSSAEASSSYFDSINVDSAYPRGSGPASPSAASRPGSAGKDSTADSSLRPAPSVRSKHGHGGPLEQPASPSYFPDAATFSTNRQPTITFTSAPSESGIAAPTSLASLSCAAQQDMRSPQSTHTSLGHIETGLPPLLATSASLPRGPSSPGDKTTSAFSAGPVSPGGSTRLRGGPSQLGFFASLRPSSPKILPHPRDDGGSERKRDRAERDAAREKDRTGSNTLGVSAEADHRSRRSSSVFEHVGNVWERFGRKVHHVRNATSEVASPGGLGAASGTSVQPRRTGGMQSAGSPASDAFDKGDEKTSPTGSSLSGSLASLRPVARRDSASSTNDQRLPAWLEESLAGEAFLNLNSPAAGPHTPREHSSNSPAPSLGSVSALAHRGAAASVGASSSPVSPSQEPLEYLDNASVWSSAHRASDRQYLAGSSFLEEEMAPNQSQHQRQFSLPDRVLIQVTEDNERFSVVDVSGVDSADAIKERMFAKLHMFDEDYSNFQLFRTEIGQTDATGPVVNDDALLALCLQMGDDRGTLKFFVHQISPPVRPASRARLPPQASSTPRRAFRDLSGSSESPSAHARTESQSSKSSVSDALVHTEFVASESGVADPSHRHSGSSLQRAKAQMRRAPPNALGTEELRSPVHSGHGASGGYDRRSTASSFDGSESFPRQDRVESVHHRRGMALEPITAHPLPLGDDPSNSLRSFSPPIQSPRLPQSQQQAPHQQRPRRPSQGADAILRPGERDPTGVPRSLQPASRRPAPSTSNSYGQSAHGPTSAGHARLRSEGEDGSPGVQAPSQLTIHSTKSMDDLHQRPVPPPPPMPLNSHHPLLTAFDRDGRYPDPSISRPSSAAPFMTEHHSSQRQVSPDIYGSKMSSTSLQPDPRALQRNRSAQAALAAVVPGPPPGGPSRVAATPGPMRSPAFPVRDGVAYPSDPRFVRPINLDDARLAGHRAPTQQHPVHRPSSARPAHAGGAAYAYPLQQPPHSSHTYDPHRPHHMPSPYVNEFGGRGPVYGYSAGPHPPDPRLYATSPGPFSARPHTLHDASFAPQHRPGMASSPPFQSREDPFTSLYFPASSSRQVSEFQMAAGRLEPGMTVQETMQSRAPPGHHHPPHQQAYVHRDLRRPATAIDGHLVSHTNRVPTSTMSPRRDLPPGVQGVHAAVERPVASSAHQQSYAQQQQQQLKQQQNHLPSLVNPHVAAQRPLVRSQQQPLQEASASLDRGVRESFGRPNASERSSGSSFSSTASHRLGLSNEDRSGRRSNEDSFSTATSTRSSQGSSVNLDFRKDHYDDDRLRRDGDLEDDDLVHVRPLPRPPQSMLSGSTEASPVSANAHHGGDPLHLGMKAERGTGETAKQTDSEDTLKATTMASLWNSLGARPPAEASDTVRTNSDSGTLRPDRSDSTNTDPSTTSTESTIIEADGADRSAVAQGWRSRNVSADVDVAANPDENGTVASFASFASIDDDDDDGESGTWAQPLDSDADAPRLPLTSTGNEAEQTLQPGQTGLSDLGLLPKPAFAATSSPRRPELKLTIETGTGPSPSQTGGVARQASPSASLLSNSSRLPSSNSQGSGGIQRSYSFAKRDNEWAFRPPPEQLYENLDDFFPKHDLDKPLLDSSGIPESPGVCSPKSDGSPAQHGLPAMSPAVPLSRHKKSIRLVAQDRKKYLDRAEKRTAASSAPGNTALSRRRSTRLWGTKVIEMTPGQEASTPASSIPLESPSAEATQKPVFKWVKGDLIGKGTYGRVYLALNATTGEMIAVKQVELPRTASDREDNRQKGVVAALKSEIETLKDLDHPHIVAYLGFEETASFLSIFLEYVPGGSVGSCLRKHGKFEEATIKSFLHQILEGLAYLHSRGILHRDLKADNILVDFEGVCKISDFGTVRRSDDIYGNVEDMSLQGSIFWMAPEVVSLSKKGYSAKVDIWSLGCVVLEMFAGRRPWSDDEAVQAMFKIGAERRAPPIPADVRLSKKAAHFLKNCFEIDPARRPTAARLLDHVFSVPEEGWHFQQSTLWRHLKK